MSEVTPGASEVRVLRARAEEKEEEDEVSHFLISHNHLDTILSVADVVFLCFRALSHQQSKAELEVVEVVGAGEHSRIPSARDGLEERLLNRSSLFICFLPIFVSYTWATIFHLACYHPRRTRSTR